MFVTSDSLKDEPMRITFAQYHEFSAPLEGRVPKMYCDVKGLITTGVGNLIDTLPQALALPWRLANGSKATIAQITADFDLCRANKDRFAKLKWTVYESQLACHLAEEDIDALVQRTLDANEGFYRKRWPKYDAFPADAQLAINSMGWAIGPAFYRKFGNLAKCVDAEDWAGCVLTCKIQDGLGTPSKADDNLGVVPRNAGNRLLFANAQVVKERGLDPAILHWPRRAEDALPPSEKVTAPRVDAAADLKAAANIALGMTDLVGLPGQNLKAFEREDGGSSGGAPIA